jgi:hypothetical protein
MPPSERWPAARQPVHLPYLFQNVTVLWGGVFLLLAVSLGAARRRPAHHLHPGLGHYHRHAYRTGIGVSTVWLRSVTRSLGIGFRFA